MIRILPSLIKKGIQKSLERIRNERALKWVERGEINLSQGAKKETLECSKRALQLYNDYAPAHSLIARALMPGDSYRSIISQFHEYLKPESYVEIGVAGGGTFALSFDFTKAIGIDPNPSIKIKMGPGKKIYPITSDEFFHFYNLFEELGTKNLALAFIDGLHTFEQALRDFINIESYANKNTVILIHDCMPINKRVASRERYTSFWTGDVWKIVPCLIENRTDLNLNIIPSVPSGLAVINNLNSESTILNEKFEEIVSEYKNQELPYDQINLKKFQLRGKYPNLLPNDWGKIIDKLSLSTET